MELSNRSKWLLGLFVAIGLFIVSIIPASAQTIAYHPLRYGTNQTSMADGYFVKPANVVVKNHLYYVTMEIKTAKSLSSFPVKVNWVNGKAPLNVRRVKDRAGDSLLYYSFYANNLKKRINAKLAIDVPKVYKAHHLISFKFSTAGLPSLGRTHAAAATPKTATSTTKPKAATSPSTKAKQTNSRPRRVKDRAGDSLLYYSFYANNLKKRINAKLAIDVPKVYKAHHLISFKFSTAGLPSLGRTHAAAATPKTATSTTKPKAATSPSTKAKQTNSRPKANAPKKTKKAAKTASSTKTKQPKAKQSSAKKASSQPSKASSNLTKPAKKTSDKPQAKKSGVPWIVGGVTVIAGLSAGLWIYFKH